MAEVYRTGRRNHRVIYRMVGVEPSDDDVMVGSLDDPELARLFVDTVNTYNAAYHADACRCELIDVSWAGGPPSYVRGLSHGCTVHPDPHEVSDAEARRRAREA